MNQALQDQQEDAKNPLPHSEDDGAERGCAGAKPSDDAPAGYLDLPRFGGHAVVRRPWPLLQ